MACLFTSTSINHLADPNSEIYVYSFPAKRSKKLPSLIFQSTPIIIFSKLISFDGLAIPCYSPINFPGIFWTYFFRLSKFHSSYLDYTSINKLENSKIFIASQKRPEIAFLYLSNERHCFLGLAHLVIEGTPFHQIEPSALQYYSQIPKYKIFVRGSKRPKIHLSQVIFPPTDVVPINLQKTIKFPSIAIPITRIPICFVVHY